MPVIWQPLNSHSYQRNKSIWYRSAEIFSNKLLRSGNLSNSHSQPLDGWLGHDPSKGSWLDPRIMRGVSACCLRSGKLSTRRGFFPAFTLRCLRPAHMNKAESFLGTRVLQWRFTHSPTTFHRTGNLLLELAVNCTIFLCLMTRTRTPKAR